jgi:hypothetical protein
MLAMKNPILALLALVTTALASGCTLTAANSVEVREFLLYGQGGGSFNERQGLFFGDTDSSIELKLGGLTLKLTKPLPAQLSAQSINVVPAEASLNVAGSLWVNGKPSFTAPLRGIADRFTLAAVPLSDDVILETRAGLESVAYYNGRNWFSVVGPVNGERKLRYSPRQRDGLRGFGNLSDREADGLAAYLVAKANGPVAVALLALETISESPWSFEPKPASYNRSALAVQFGVPTDLFGNFTPPQFSYKDLANGAIAAYNDDAALLRLDEKQSDFNQTWNMMNGNQLPLPIAPTLDFKQYKVVTLFIGQRATGGYGASLRDAKIEGETLVLNVTLTAPKPNSFTTQVITSPYLSILASGDFSQVRAIDQTGRTVASVRR